MEFSELFYRSGEDGTHRMLRPEQLSEFELKGVQSTLEERLEKVRLELQDAEFCAAVLSLQRRSVVLSSWRSFCRLSRTAFWRRS